MVEKLSRHEQEVLSPYFTNLDRDVFGLVNLPEVVKGTLFSRYSRTDKSLRRVLLDEFMHMPEMPFEEIVVKPSQQPSDSLVATEKAEAFYDRVLVGYGDDSVAELAGAHVACENVSSLAADYLTDSRIGISPLEKSARYVTFDKKVNGEYLYYKEPRIMRSGFRDGYVELMNQLFEAYAHWLDRALQYVRSKVPRDEKTSERAYLSATRAQACDIVKNVLPASRLTNVGLYGNGRAFEYLLSKLYSADIAETNQLANDLHGELRKLISSFVKRAERIEHIAGRRRRLSTAPLQDGPAVAAQGGLSLVDFDEDGETKVVAAILFPDAHAYDLRHCLDKVSGMPPENRRRIVAAYIAERQNRRERPGRAFENTYYTFEFVASYGVYRDLHRHRLLTQEAQPLTADLGYAVPEEFHDLRITEECQRLMAAVAGFYYRVVQSMPLEAQYVLPRLFRRRWYMKMNLREVYHIVELRSGRQGHPEYRRIAQEMYKLIKAVHPTLVEHMLVDMADYSLARLDSERRFDEKTARLQRQSP